jgi:hypothetical protein
MRKRATPTSPDDDPTVGLSANVAEAPSTRATVLIDRCIPRYVRSAEKRPKCHFNHAMADLSTAESVTRTGVPVATEPDAACDLPAASPESLNRLWWRVYPIAPPHI